MVIATRKRDQGQACHRFGLRVRQARLKADLSQERLARKVGVARAHFVNLEGGKSWGSIPLLRRIAMATMTSTDWLLFGDKGERLREEANGDREGS